MDINDGPKSVPPAVGVGALHPKTKIISQDTAKTQVPTGTNPLQWMEFLNWVETHHIEPVTLHTTIDRVWNAFGAAHSLGFAAGRAEGVAQVFRDIEAAEPKLRHPDKSAADYLRGYEEGKQFGGREGYKRGLRDALPSKQARQEIKELKIAAAEAGTERTEMFEALRRLIAVAKEVQGITDAATKGHKGYFLHPTFALGLAQVIKNAIPTVGQMATWGAGEVEEKRSGGEEEQEKNTVSASCLSCATEARAALDWVMEHYQEPGFFFDPVTQGEIREELTRRFQSQWADGYGVGTRDGAKSEPGAVPPAAATERTEVVACLGKLKPVLDQVAMWLKGWARGESAFESEKAWSLWGELIEAAPTSSLLARWSGPGGLLPSETRADLPVAGGAASEGGMPIEEIPEACKQHRHDWVGVQLVKLLCRNCACGATDCGTVPWFDKSGRIPPPPWTYAEVVEKIRKKPDRYGAGTRAGARSEPGAGRPDAAGGVYLLAIPVVANLRSQLQSAVDWITHLKWQKAITYYDSEQRANLDRDHEAMKAALREAPRRARPRGSA